MNIEVEGQQQQQQQQQLTSPQQIEQFIESVFPTQDPEVLARKARGEPADPKKAAADAETRKDMLYTVGFMLLLLSILTAIMVRRSLSVPKADGLVTAARISPAPTC